MGLTSLVAQMVKNLPATWDTWVGSLGWKDPLEKGKATHSSILAWRILLLPLLLQSTAAAAAAKSLQSCPILCDPIDGSPPVLVMR